MIPLTLQQIADATGGSVSTGDPSLTVDAVTTDSRDVPGDHALFVAIRGEHADGHDFLDGAVDNGAAALLSERDSDADVGVVRVEDTWKAIGDIGATVRTTVDPFVVGITGSVGKTTTKDLTGAALRAGRRTKAARGSFNNELGVPLTLLSVERDTEALVVEIGARGVGHIAKLTPWVTPDVAIVTAVAGVHLELFGDLEAVATAKGELVESLSSEGTAVLNGDDHRVRAMASRCAGRVLLYGVEGAERPDDVELDLTATDVKLDRFARASFTAHTPWGSASVTLPLAGRHHVSNALAALAAACTAGVELQAAAAALADAPISDWRGEVIEADGVVVLNDAYNANPTSTAAALEMLTSVERSGRAIAVLGVMAEIGDEHESEHEAIGARAVAEGIDRLIVVGEDAAGIARGAQDAGMSADACTRVADADEALRQLDDLAAGDVLLVKASRVGGLERVADGIRERRTDDRVRTDEENDR